MRFLPDRWRPSEGLVHFVVFSIVLSIAQVVSGTIGTALVLSSAGPERLPILYIVLACLSVPLAVGLSTLIDRTNQVRLFQVELAVCATIAAGFWLLIISDVPLAAEGVYMTAKLQDILGDIVFWVVVTQYFTSLEIRKVAIVLGVAFAVGGVCAGGLAAILLEHVPVPVLLLMSAGLYAVLIFQLGIVEARLRPIGRGPGEELEEGDSSLLQALAALPAIFRRHPMALWICVGVFLMIASYCFTEYVFYSIYLQYYPTAIELTAFLAVMNGALQAAELVLLVAVAQPLIAHTGPVVRNLALPLTSLLSLGAMLAGFRLPAAIAAHINGDAFNNAVFEPVKTVNLVAIPHRYAGRVRTVADGAMFPLGLVLAGFALLLLQEGGASLTGIGIVGILVTGLFAYVGWRTGRAYLPALVKNLSAGTIDFARASLLPGNPQELAQQVGGLLAAQDREARLFGLRLAARLGEAAPLEQIVAAILQSDAAMRQAAVAALAAMPLEAQRSFLLQALAAGQSAATRGGEAEAMRTVAMGLMLSPRFARDEMMRRCAAESLDAAVRTTAIAAGVIAPSGGHRVDLLKLVEDFLALDPPARARIVEALSAAAAAEVASPATLQTAVPLLLALVERGDRATRREALVTLSLLTRRGDATASDLAAQAARDEEADVRAAAAMVLSAAATDSGIEHLGFLLRDPVRSVRLAAARALATYGGAGEQQAMAALHDPSPAVVEAATLALGGVANRVAREALFAALKPCYARIAASRKLAQQLAATGPSVVADALAVAIADADRRALDRVLQVLEALSRDRTVRDLRRALETPDRRGRADAVVAFASLPNRRFVAPLVPLLTTLAHADEVPPKPLPGRRAAADPAALRAVAERAAANDDPWIRRIGAWALCRLNETAEDEESDAMDRLLFLKGVSLFREVTFDDLLALNAAMETVEYLAGETVIADGSVGSSFFLVAEGELAVRKAGRDLARLSAGGFFGEMALIDAAPRAADVIALTDCRLLRLTRAAFQSLTDEHPRVLAELCRLFVRRLRRAQEQIQRQSQGESHDQTPKHFQPSAAAAAQ